MLEHNHDVGDLWHYSHQQGDIWVYQDSLHNNFVLNLSKKIVSDRRIENFLDCDGAPVQETLVDYTEASLADLLSKLDVVHSDFPHSWHGRQSSIFH